MKRYWLGAFLSLAALALGIMMIAGAPAAASLKPPSATRSCVAGPSLTSFGHRYIKDIVDVAVTDRQP
jgi:hypothetical protein